jgi:colicin import membrane protein
MTTLSSHPISLPVRARLLVPALLLLATQVLAASAPLAAPAPGASASASLSAAEERKQIARERDAVQVEFLARERECRERFIVTSCLDKAKSDRRQALDRLRARQIVVDEQRRHERSDERKAELLEKATEDARRESARAAHAAASAATATASQPASEQPLRVTRPASASSAASGAREHPRASGAGVGVKPRPHEPQSVREQHEADSRAAFEARQAEAAAHREEAMDRASKRTGQKAAAAPLPVPGAASALPGAAPASSSRP